MKTFLFLKIFLLGVSFISCDRSSNEKIVKKGWSKKNICDHWVLQLPSGTSVKGNGCTNDLKSPGIIYFPNDSIQLEFYAFGPPLDKKTVCDFDSTVKWAEKNSSEGICQGDGSISYNVSPYINYSRKMAGTIGKATYSSKYLTTLQIEHCSKWNLTLIFRSLSPYYDNVATEIIKSVEFVKSSDTK